MKEILNTMLSALTRGEGVMLCSILKADGSSPRGAGAHMAVFSDGTALGTVGGGAVERQSILLARELLEGKRNALRDFALHPEAANSTGMVCGGDVTVWFQYIPPENAAQIGVLRAWRDALGSGRNVWLCLMLDGETLREFRLLTADELRHGTEGFFTSRPYWDGSTFVEPIVRAGRVYLFGAGHVGRPSPRCCTISALRSRCTITARSWQAPHISPRRMRSSSAISAVFLTRSR